MTVRIFRKDQVNEVIYPMKRENTSDEAVLSSSGEFTSFSFNGRNIRFRTSSALDRYVEVKEWDNSCGYIVVTARYRGVDEEEYIDLLPTLEDLYIDAGEFLKPIKKVRISYDEYT